MPRAAGAISFRSPASGILAWWFVALAFVLSVSACKKREKAHLPGDDVALATVNGDVVTQYDVDKTAERVLGGSRKDHAQEGKAAEQVLRSVIQQRAIAAARWAELPAEGRAAVEKEVRRYREQLLVRQYVLAHNKLLDVTPKMVRDYYDRNPKRFGAKSVKLYEIVASDRVLKPGERQTVVKWLSDLRSAADWRDRAEQGKAAGLPLTYRRGEGDGRLLDPGVRQMAAGLSKGQLAGPTLIRGRAVVVRVVDEVQRPPRSLDEVSDEIRQLLEPGRFSEALEALAPKVLEKTKVEVLRPNPAKAAQRK